MIRAVAVAAALVLGLAILTLGAQSPPAQDTAADRPPFGVFLAGVRTEALTRGISQATLDRAFVDVTPETVVVSRDRSQPENVQSLDSYISQRLSRRTITTARQMADRHRGVLDAVE